MDIVISDGEGRLPWMQVSALFMASVDQSSAIEVYLGVGDRAGVKDSMLLISSPVRVGFDGAL